MEMYDFFYNELVNLKAKTGFNQWEKLNEAKDPGAEINSLIDFMIQECNKPPFDIVKPEVKQRVIARAVVEDQDFIGLNAKFVRKALGAWWLSNGDRVMEERNRKAESIYEKVPLSPEKSAEIDRMLDEYKRRILSDAGFKPVPKVSVDVLERDGAERQKATPYPVTSLAEARRHELHLEWARRNFDVRTQDKLPSWKPEQEWIEGLSEEERKAIFDKADL